MADRRTVARDFTLFSRSEASREEELRAEFRKKWSWIVDDRPSAARRYATILGNLTRRYEPGTAATTEVVRDAIVAGFGGSAFDRLKAVLGVSAEDLGNVLRIPPRTLARRTTFKPDESERILRVGIAFQRAIEVLGELDEARHWFSSPKRALGGRTPFEFCDTEPGAAEVVHLLGRIEHGVFS